MKIFCCSCREYILETTDQFVPGGPYHGAMFGPADQPRWSGPNYFKFQEWVRGGDLCCPRCDELFIKADGSIHTDFGWITPQHSATPPENSDKKLEISHTCKSCGKAFASPQALAGHMRVHK